MYKGVSKIENYDYKFKILVTNFILMSILYGNSEVLVEKYEERIPIDVKVNIKNNDSAPEFLNYVFIKTIDAPVREHPIRDAKELVRFSFNKKLKVLEKVQVNMGEWWYKVELENTVNGRKIGYISSSLVELRKFRFKMMNDEVHKLSTLLKDEVKKGKKLISTNTYVPNPKNENLSRLKDKYDVSADQNAKGLYGDEVIYIPDRSVMSIEKFDEDYAYVNVFSISEKPLKIKKRVLSKKPIIDPNFKKAIVIDLENENQGIFEKNEMKEWELISYTLNKTGLESSLGFETPKGYFIVPVVRYEMFYADECGKIAGMAKYAIRFSGGGYIHGTPIDFNENINRDFFLEEKDRTLGTVEGTRKCVRNPEEHIRFLFHWATGGKSVRTMNSQIPNENVMVIVL